MEQLVTIELFGQPYTFKAKSEVMEARQVADLLSKEVNRVQHQQSDASSKLTNLTVLMLAALNIAYENLELRKQHTKLLDSIYQRSANLIRTLDDGVR